MPVVSAFLTARFVVDDPAYTAALPAAEGHFIVVTSIIMLCILYKM